MFSNPYIKIVLALTGIFVLLAAYSLYPTEIKIAEVKIKKSEFKETLLASAEEASLKKDSVASKKTAKMLGKQLADSAKVFAPKDSAIAEERKALDTTRQSFLFIGDSMLEGLRQRLNDYCKENGHTMNTVIWYSSSSLWYGNCDTISYFIKKHKPTYVLICLGANELFIRNIKKDRANLVAHIVQQVGNLPYVWIGPPNWKADTGINDLIVEYAGKNHYFESKKLKFARSKDGAHPTLGSARIWMDSVAAYIEKESCCPIRLKKPSKIYKGYPSTTLLQPNPPAGL
jgi:lysophospholipase L1-like esterase